MTEGLEQLLDSLLYEGYALYPYTPGATKNATPTPFGIVYPPVYAADSAATFDHARLEGLAVLDGSKPTLGAELVYLAPSGERHQATPRRVSLGPVEIGSGGPSSSKRGASRCDPRLRRMTASTFAPASTTRAWSHPDSTAGPRWNSR